MKLRRLLGSWWTAARPDRQVPGTLLLAPFGKVRLRLHGTLSDRRIGLIERETFPVILGISMKGRRVTLHDCDLVGRSGLELGQITHYAVNEAYVGAHFEEPTGPPAVRHVQAEYSDLLNWVRFSPWAASHNLDVDILSEPRGITWRPDISLSASHQGATLTLTSWMEPEGRFHEDVRVRRRLSLGIESPEPLTTYEWHRRYLHPFRHFLALGTTRATTLSSFTVIPDIPEGGVPQLVSVFNYYIGPSVKGPKWFTPSDALFHLGDIEGSFSTVLARWFVVYEKLRPVCDQFFGLAYNPPTYVDQRLLTLVSAAEAYHRETVGPRKGLSLHDRLTSLLGRADDIAGPLVKDRAAFLKQVVRTRNMLTHLTTKDAHQIPGPNAIYRLSRTLNFVLRRCLLRDLELAPEQCQALFARNRDYIWAKEDVSV